MKKYVYCIAYSKRSGSMVGQMFSTRSEAAKHLPLYRSKGWTGGVVKLNAPTPPTEAEKLDRAIVRIKDFDNEDGAYQKELVEKIIPELDRKGLRLLTCNETRILVSERKFYDKYYAYLPLWTGTKVKYTGTVCEVTELGKTWKTSIPPKDGWYELDEHGLPFGKPASSEGSNVGYLWRVNAYEGFLSRYCRWGGGYWRVVGAYGYWFYYRVRRGVLAVPKNYGVI